MKTERFLEIVRALEKSIARHCAYYCSQQLGLPQQTGLYVEILPF